MTEQGDSHAAVAQYRRAAGSVFSGGAQVNQLVLINRGKRPLLLLAGEVVSGGKQDRIIAKDRIIPIGAKPLPLDVFCVEHSRWTSGDAKIFRSANDGSSHRARKGRVDQDQSQVWAAVRGDMAAANGASDNGSNLAVAPPPISSQQLSR